MKLVIAEKPMLARDIARAICGVSVSETARLPISGNGWCVCACAGHLLELKEPHEINEKWKEWDLDDLPISIENWPKRPSVDKEKLVKDIGDLLKSADMVVNAGDPDDEGQLIVDEVLEYLGWNGKTERVFVNDNIEKNIVKAFENLKDNSECENVGRAAYGRQMADMCFGVNETRLATKRLGSLLSIGRVQTPTIGLVVERDRQIENHEVRKFYTLNIYGNVIDANNKKSQVLLKFEPNKSLLSDEKYIFDIGVLEGVQNSLNGFRGRLSVKEQKKTKNPPLPYNLTQLQADMSKRFKMSAKKTLDITQNLRDKYKAITYNRSDCQYLKDEHFEQAQSVLTTALKNLGISYEVDYSIKSKAFNEKNVSAHHGIIPQDVNFSFSDLTKDEQNVYRSIVERYVMQFMQPVVTIVSEGSISIEQGELKYKYVFEDPKLNQKSYKTLMGNVAKDDEDDTSSANEGNARLQEGDYDFTYLQCSIKEGETKPPSRYTEGTLIKDMASISKYVKDPNIKAILKEKDDGKKGENGGIGTTATRAAIIEKLKERGYIEEKKSQIISTQKAREFYEIIPKEIRSADVTASWWLKQQNIADGKADVNCIQKAVVEVFNQHKNTAYAGASIATKEVMGICPKCGKNVIKSKTSYQCESNKWVKDESTGAWSCADGCQFSLSGWSGKKFSDAQVKSLLGGKKVALKGCISKKTGKNFDCKVYLDENHSLKPEFEMKKKKK